MEQHKNISYLKARDPSIVTFNRPKLCGLKTNLVEEFDEEPQQQKDEIEQICVYLRIKAGYDFQDLYKIDGKYLTSIVPAGSNFLRNIREGETMKKTYTFTKIFEPETSQRDIFNQVVKQKILDFINGQNSTLLTYGASGSGKTFTIIGTDCEPGIVPRSLEYLFRSLPQLSKTPIAKPSASGEVTLLNEVECKREKLFCRTLLNSSIASMDRAHHCRTYTAMQQRLSTEPVAELDNHFNISIGVWISFAEIYNEHIYDLLQLDPPRGHQRPKLRLGMSKGQAYIKNLTNVSVTSGQEAYQILQYGLHNLNYASTQLNAHSSRSHSIFTIKLVQVNGADGGNCVSCFNFCDLAGSERSKKTQNMGERLKESNNINSSLLVLGRCISAVRNLQKQNDNKLVPFRESKLTQLFQKALTGGEDIVMIVNISPSREMFDESQHVLNFSAVAKDIILERQPVKLEKKSRFSRLVESSKITNSTDVFDVHQEEEYVKAILTLQEELEIQRTEYETNQKMNLDYVRKEYGKLLSSVEEDTQRRVKNAERVVQLRYENKLANMKLKYEAIIDELKNSDIIEIDSSDEETTDTNKTKIHNSSQILASTLQDGVKEYLELEEQCKELKQDKLQLQEKCLDLEHQIEIYRNEIRRLKGEEEYSSDEQSTECGEDQTI